MEGLAQLSPSPNGLVDTECHEDHGHQQEAEDGSHQHCKRKTGYRPRAAQVPQVVHWQRCAQCHSGPGTVPGVGEPATTELALSPCMWGENVALSAARKMGMWGWWGRAGGGSQWGGKKQKAGMKETMEEAWVEEMLCNSEYGNNNTVLQIPQTAD